MSKPQLQSQRNYSGSLHKVAGHHQALKRTVLDGKQQVGNSSALSKANNQSSVGSNVSNSTGLSGSATLNQVSSGIPKAKKKNNTSQLSGDAANKNNKSLMVNSGLNSHRGSSFKQQKTLAKEQVQRDSPREHSSIKKFDFMNYEQANLEVQYEQLRIPRACKGQLEQQRKSKSNDKQSFASSQHSHDQRGEASLQEQPTPEILKLKDRSKVAARAFTNMNKPPISQLQISIPPDNEDQQIELVRDMNSNSFRNGEENLNDSSEKKKMRADVVPKSTTIKTGTHLGQRGQSKNIFLSKFVSNSTKNSNDPVERQRFDFALQRHAKQEELQDATPKIQNKTCEQRIETKKHSLQEKIEEATRQIGQVTIDSLKGKSSTIRGVS